jgi:hypothetical protein
MLARTHHFAPALYCACLQRAHRSAPSLCSKAHVPRGHLHHCQASLETCQHRPRSTQFVVGTLRAHCERRLASATPFLLFDVRTFDVAPNFHIQRVLHEHAPPESGDAVHLKQVALPNDCPQLTHIRTTDITHVLEVRTTAWCKHYMSKHTLWWHKEPY